MTWKSPFLQRTWGHVRSTLREKYRSTAHLEGTIDVVRDEVRAAGKYKIEKTGLICLPGSSPRTEIGRSHV